MNKADFIAEVVVELNIIKNNATPVEIDRLNKELFDATLKSQCIYGLMTGDCMSERAREIHGKTYRYATGNDSKIIAIPFIAFEDHSLSSQHLRSICLCLPRLSITRSSLTLEVRYLQ